MLLWAAGVLEQCLAFPCCLSAGLAYEICRGILGSKCPLDLQPGGSITAAELLALHTAATAAAITTGQQADALFARSLSAVAVAKGKGDWHVLPDLLTMLSSDWFVSS